MAWITIPPALIPTALKVIKKAHCQKLAYLKKNRGGGEVDFPFYTMHSCFSDNQMYHKTWKKESLTNKNKQSHQRYSVSYKVSRSIQQKIVTAADHLLTALFTRNKPSGHEKFQNEIFCLIFDTCFTKCRYVIILAIFFSVNCYMVRCVKE